MKTYVPRIFLILLIISGCVSSESPNLEDEIRAIENGLSKRIQISGEAVETYSIEERMAQHRVPGVSIAIVRDGKIRWAKGYGSANTRSGSLVDTKTLFQAGSISKPIAALAAMKLVEQNKVDLDENVNNYLIDWKLEENRFTQSEPVTLRRLLTHTAGTTVHGFPGYTQSDTFPSIQQVLNGAGNTPRVFVDTIPGSIWRYSGGGYTIMEKLVEDVSGLPLEQYLSEYILAPLQMRNSTYAQPLPEAFRANASAAYDWEGKLIEGLWHNYPEQAAAGLWTTPTDLATYYIAIQEILAGDTEGVLTKEIVEQMLTKHKNDWGLGPSLAWAGDSLRFQHGGKNAGFTNEMIGFAYRGDAVIIMTNADNGGKLIGELLRSVSLQYGWGISEPRVVEPQNVSTDAIDKFTGKYLYAKQVPGIGNYFVEVTREDRQLVVLDANNGERDVLRAVEPLKFIDLEDGDEMVFEVMEDSITFRWNGRYLYSKVE